MYPVLFHQTEYILVLLSKDIMKTAEEIMLMCKQPTAIIPRLLWLPNFLRHTTITVTAIIGTPKDRVQCDTSSVSNSEFKESLVIAPNQHVTEEAIPLKLLLLTIIK